MTQTTSLTFATRLMSLKRATISMPASRSRQNQIKKQARVAISLQYTSPSLGFLHATLACVDSKFFLLAGPSGIGKTTYAEKIRADGIDVRILANDWVGVEREGDQFYVSDLNFPSDLRHKKRCLLAGIIFFTYEDTYGCDIFTPDNKDFTKRLRECFDTSAPEEADLLSSFWLENRSSLPFCCVVPARRKPEEYTAKTVQRVILKVQDSSSDIEVGVIGMGIVGRELAFQLGQLDEVKKVHLFNRSHEKTKGYALDMNHGIPSMNGEMFVPHPVARQIFEQSSVVFLSFRDESVPMSTNLPERWRRLSAHFEAMKYYSQIACDVDFKGTIFVISNPVDLLTYICHSSYQGVTTGLRTNQVYGIGLELDLARVVSYSRHLTKDLHIDDVILYGNHADTLVLHTNLDDTTNKKLLDLVQGASAEIRAQIPRTVYGPVQAAMRTFQAYIRGYPTHVTVLQESGHIGRKVQFRFQLPVFGETILNHKEYGAILRDNLRMIEDYPHLM